MPQLLADIAFNTAYVRPLYGFFSGTTDSSGFLTVAHGAPFVPSVYFIQPIGDPRAGNVAVPFVFAIDAQNITLGYFAVAGSAATLAVSGSFLVFQ